MLTIEQNIKLFKNIVKLRETRVMIIQNLEMSIFFTELREQISKQGVREPVDQGENYAAIDEPYATSGYQGLQMARR